MSSDEKTGYLREIWDALRSVRLTIVLFAVLAVASIVGTIIPQNLEFQKYEAMYGVFASRVLMVLGMTDLYHAFWFVALLVVLAANLLACSIHRFPGTLKLILAPQRPLTDRLWESLPVRRKIRLDGEHGEASAEIRRELSRRRWSVTRQTRGEETHLMAQKGRYGRLGVYVTHLGVLLILSGALIGFKWGFKGFMRIPEGEIVAHVQEEQDGDWVDLGFQVRCDAFTVSHYPDGTPREFRSDLTFLEDGKVVLKGPLRVNHPMHHRGFSFYQASYGDSTSVTLEAREASEAPARNLQISLGETALLDAQKGIRIHPLRYQKNFQGKGPAVLLAMIRPGGTPVGGWLVKGEGPVRIQGWILKLVGTRSRGWTGIQVRKDPGVGLVWAGFVLVIVGCWMAFFVPHRRLWVRLRREGGGALCHLGARASRADPGLERKVDDVVRAWKKAVGFGMPNGEDAG